MSTPDTVSGIEFAGESFAVESALLGMDYAIKAESGGELLWAKRRFFDERDEYEFRGEDDVLVFQYVRADPVDGRTRFHLVDGESGTVLASLVQEEEGSKYRWEVRPASTDEVGARIEAQSGRLPVIQSPNARQMDITTADGRAIGQARKRLLSVRFTFDVDLPELHGVTKAATLLAVPLLYDEMQPGSEFRKMGDN